MPPKPKAPQPYQPILIAMTGERYTFSSSGSPVVIRDGEYLEGRVIRPTNSDR